MPIIKSAQKRMRQAETRRKRNYVVRRKVKSAIKDFSLLVKDKKMSEAEKSLPAVFKAIDTAAKKNILHKNTASRRKSFLAKSLRQK